MTQRARSTELRVGGMARLRARFKPSQRQTGAGGDRGVLLGSFAQLAGEVADEGKRVLSTSLRVARQSNEQYERLSSSHVLIEEIRRMARESSEVCKVACGKMSEAYRLVETCLPLARKRTEMMHRLMGAVEQSTAGFDEVKASVNEVEQFLRIIQRLGDQTQLLALNATIEASRAGGVQGAGFGVVAREMRVLADQSKTATDQIKCITERVLRSTATASEALVQALASSSSYREYADRVEQVLIDSLKKMGEAERKSGAVTAAAEHQIETSKVLEGRWNEVGESAKNCTFAADAAAEMSMRTIQLAARFYEGLLESESELETEDETSCGQQRGELRAAEEACREAAGVAALEALRGELEHALKLLERECLRHGLPLRQRAGHEGEAVWELCFGRECLNMRHEQVDAVRSPMSLPLSVPGPVTSGNNLAELSATLFVLSEGSKGEREFVRVATTVRHANGERATGTALNPCGVVAPQLLDGKKTFGYVYIMGLPYIASYAPIQDVTGQTVGAYYVGKRVQLEG